MKKIILAFSLFLFTFSAQAETCSGIIERIQIGNVLSIASGDIYGITNAGGHDICSMTENKVSASGAVITPSNCKLWYKLALSAYHSGNTLTIQYPDAIQCSNVQAWSNAETPDAVWIE